MRSPRLLTAAISVAVGLSWTLPAAAAGVIRDAEIENTLHRLSSPIFRAAGLREDAVKIWILGDSQPNAFVFDGRQMAVTTGLIQDMGGPTELQGVVAHEMGHITGGHQARRAIAVRSLQGPALIASIIAAGAAAAAGAGGGAVGAGLGAQSVALRALLAHTRAEEASADQAALTFLDAARISPEGMKKVLDRFRDQEVFLDGDRDPFVLTHPLSSARLELVDRRAAESRWTGQAPDPEDVYWFERMKAKFDGFIDHPATVLNATEGKTGEFDLLRRAAALHRLPDPPAAVAVADRLIAMRPADPYYHELRGQILLESGRGPEAVPSYREALRLAPGEPLIRAQLGRALLTLNEPKAAEEAVTMLEDGIAASDGGDPQILRDLAFAYARAGREGEAALATAERLALVGATHDAVIQARRAKELLPKSSSKWLRADDIVESLTPLAEN